METVKIELEVAKGTYELGQALAALMINSKAALKDGFQAGQDLPAVITESLNALILGVQGAMSVSAEAKEDVEKFADAIYVGMKPGVFALIKE